MSLFNKKKESNEYLAAEAALNAWHWDGRDIQEVNKRLEMLNNFGKFLEKSKEWMTTVPEAYRGKVSYTTDLSDTNSLDKLYESVEILACDQSGNALVNLVTVRSYHDDETERNKVMSIEEAQAIWSQYTLHDGLSALSAIEMESHEQYLNEEASQQKQIADEKVWRETHTWLDAVKRQYPNAEPLDCAEEAVDEFIRASYVNEFSYSDTANPEALSSAECAQLEDDAKNMMMAALNELTDEGIAVLFYNNHEWPDSVVKKVSDIREWQTTQAKTGNLISPPRNKNISNNSLPTREAFIRCESDVIGVLRGLGVACGEYNSARKGVTASLTEMALKGIAQFPSDFVVEFQHREPNLSFESKREPKSEVAENLRKYLDTPELVAGWITPQAVMLKDGRLACTSYYRTGTGGLILRESLDADEEGYRVNHRESTAGLFARFEAGERYDPYVVVSEILPVILVDSKPQKFEKNAEIHSSPSPGV